MNKNYFQEVYEGLQKAIVTQSGREIPLEEGIEQWVQQTKQTNENGGLVFFCGNGASATMAEHMSFDWFQNGKINTYSCSETSYLTAISNDIAYEEVFACRIRRNFGQKDIMVTISSSGNSPNIIRAIEVGKEKGVFIVTVSGRSADNQSRKMGDLNFYVPLDTYGLVESAHAALLHCVLDEYLERYMGGRH